MRRRIATVISALLLAAMLPAVAMAAEGPEFTVQPGGGQAGGAWAQQPVVSILSAKQVVTSATGSITLSISPGTGAPGAVLTCTTNPVALVNGVATFAGCRINLEDNRYRLIATWNQGGSDVSSAFDIEATAGVGTKLGFTVQPARGTPAVAFASQPVVAVQFANGTTVTNAAPTAVTLALGANPTSAVLTCSGGLTVTTSNGVANFSGCRLDKVGVGFTIVATAASLASATSNLFDVADRLLFTTQPAGAAGGIAFTTQPVIAVRAGASATATHDSATSVTLGIKAGTGAVGAVLTCTGGLSKTVTNGVATFAGCSIDKASPISPANPYILVATASGLTSAESSTLAVAAGAATKLVFTVQPVGATAAQPLATQPVVAITDAGGNIVTTGASSTKTVTLALGANPGGGVLTCTGGLSKVAVAGVATFAGCTVSKPGTGYTLIASSTGLTSATSTPFNVSSGANLSLTNSASVITWGNGVSLTVRIDQFGANRSVQLQGSKNGTSWSTIATLTTNSSGVASFTYRPATNLFYRAQFGGAPDLNALSSGTTRTVVRQISLLRPTNLGSIKRVTAGTRVLFVNTVRPARPELVPATVRFVFYRRTASGTWSLYNQRDVVINAAGLASTSWTFPLRGEWYVRSQARPTPDNANSVWGPLERYSVR